MIHPFEMASLTGNASSTEKENPTGMIGKRLIPRANKLAHNIHRFLEGKLQMNPIENIKVPRQSILYIRRYFWVLSSKIPITADPVTPAMINTKPAIPVYPEV